MKSIVKKVRIKKNQILNGGIKKKYFLVFNIKVKTNFYSQFLTVASLNSKLICNTLGGPDRILDLIS